MVNTISFHRGVGDEFENNMTKRKSLMFLIKITCMQETQEDDLTHICIMNFLIQS